LVYFSVYFWSKPARQPHSRCFERNKRKKPENLLILRLLTSVGITGLEPATSRPPEATQLALNPVDNHHFSNYREGESDGFRDGFHHVGLNFNISISRFDSLESGAKLQIKFELTHYFYHFFSRSHSYYWINDFYKIIIFEIYDKIVKGDIIRLFNELCPQ